MEKVLVVRFSSIGDIVLTTPVLRCLRNQSQAEIHYLTKAQYAPILRSNPNVDKVHVLTEDNFSDLVKSLKRESFDNFVDLHNNLRTKRLKTALRVPFSMVNKENFKKWLMVNLKSKKRLDHMVKRYMDTLIPLGIKNDEEGLDYYIADNTDISSIIREGEKFISLAIGGQHNTKKLPKDKLGELLDAIDLKVILLGGKEDEAVGQLLSDGRPDVLNLCGAISLDESAALVQKSELLITHDTGMMHIAAALKKPILSIWGNTVPEFGMSPYLQHDLSRIFQNNELSCRPCSKIGFEQCPKKHFKCMVDQDLESIASTARDIFFREEKGYQHTPS